MGGRPLGSARGYVTGCRNVTKAAAGRHAGLLKIHVELPDHRTCVTSSATVSIISHKSNNICIQRW